MARRGTWSYARAASSPHRAQLRAVKRRAPPRSSNGQNLKGWRATGPRLNLWHVRPLRYTDPWCKARLVRDG
eukprot:scaffold1996_cov132-Isochrysis_galbana.AAC.9